jgi:hypothetical protein
MVDRADMATVGISHFHVLLDAQLLEHGRTSLIGLAS